MDVSSYRDREFLMELVRTVLIKLNLNEVCQWYTVKHMQIYWPHSSRLLPGFSPSWKAQTSFHIYLSGAVPLLNFPAPWTLGSAALQKPWRISFSLEEAEIKESQKPSVCLTAVSLWKRGCESRQLLAWKPGSSGRTHWAAQWFPTPQCSWAMRALAFLPHS